MENFRVWVDKTDTERGKVKTAMIYVGENYAELVFDAYGWELRYAAKTRNKSLQPLRNEDGSITSFRKGDTRKSEGILMMGTGMIDMDGREIYMGDIVGIFYTEDGVQSYDLGSVSWADGAWLLFPEGSVTANYLHQCYRSCRVIGNVCENPELLDCIEHDE